ncbi:MAG: sugar ABC transporter ATP-binding protein [Velocimicrobium sp.]
MNEQYLVEMKDTSKRFGGVRALDHMQFKLKSGEIHALIGENGAGKSTLMKILSGAYTADEGIIEIEGKPMRITSPKTSMDLGISVIYQEFMLAPHLTVMENIYIDRLSKNCGLINWKELRGDAKRILSEIGFEDINPEDKVGDLSIAYQQIVEICKSLSRNVKILVLDEPSAVLTFNETQKLFELLRKLRDKNMGIIYISHRLEELFELCNNITIMKDGCYVGRYNINDIDKQGLIQKMVGRELKTLFPKRNSKVQDTILEVEKLNAGKQVQNVSFYVKRGEVVGFSGLVGAGRTETMRVIFGEDTKESGSIKYKGKVVEFRNPSEAVKNGVGLLPEDRKQQGVLLEMPIGYNVTLAAMKKITRKGILNHKKDKEFAIETLERVTAKYANINDNVESLSGGNQQKVALSKWLAADCELMILDEPTRGVDVGAKAEIYKKINDLAESGVAIIMISSEMEEVIHMSDRVYVMRQGRITGELQKEDLIDINVMRLCVEE